VLLSSLEGNRSCPVTLSKASRLASVALFLLSFLVPLAFLNAEPDISIDRIRMYLGQKRSPLVASTQTFVEQGKLNNVDPRLVVAIAGAETGFGLRLCAPNNYNAWNYFFNNGRCPGSMFVSWNDGVTKVSAYLRRRFISRRGALTTIEQIGATYCPEPSCEPWVPNVTRFYRDELGGDISDLRFNRGS